MAAARSWGGRISLTVWFFTYLLFGAVARIWETSHKRFGFAFFCSSSNEGKHLTGTLFLHLFAEITAWTASQDYSMCLSHPCITATSYVERPFNTFILKRVSALPSPRLGFLVIVRFIIRVIVLGHGQETGSARANLLMRDLSLLCTTGSTWLQASQEWFPQWQFCCERQKKVHTVQNIHQDSIEWRGFGYWSFWRVSSMISARIS